MYFCHYSIQDRQKTNLFAGAALGHALEVFELLALALLLLALLLLKAAQRLGLFLLLLLGRLLDGLLLAFPRLFLFDARL